MKKTFALMMAAACCAAQAVTVKPENTDEILVNPDMGLVMFHYSNRQWAYGQLQERGDTLDWFPGVSTIYFRLPWCLLEPQEGQYRWDLFDSYAAPWIAAGKQIAFRVTCCESRYTYATPEWVKDAGAKGWFFKMKMMKIYGKDPPGAETDIWEPDYGDPVFLKKLENFLKAMARRYNGKPYVAFMDIGTIGMWGEGHTRAYEREMKAQGRDPREAFHLHYELHRRIFPNTTLLCIDDQAGSSDPRPAAEVPLMKQAHDLGFGFRDDSILVFTSSMVPARLKQHPWWFHANWADYFAPAAPVFVEHEHYNLSRDRGGVRRGLPRHLALPARLAEGDLRQLEGRLRARRAPDRLPLRAARGGLPRDGQARPARHGQVHVGQRRRRPTLQGRHARLVARGRQGPRGVGLHGRRLRLRGRPSGGRRH